MTVRDLGDILARIGIEPTPRELADVLWLAILAAEQPGSAPSSQPSHSADLPETPAATVSAATFSRPQDKVPPPKTKTTVPERDSRLDSFDVRLPGSGAASQIAAISQTPIQAVASPALHDPLPLTRALRPLRRQLAFGHGMKLDEEATADLGAEQRLWLPVLAPATQPALDLALVIDASDSMALWDRLIRDFKPLCEQLGAFRDIRSWHLITDRAGSSSEPTVRGASPSSGLRDPRELLDPTGRRLILVITDGVHPWWQPSGPLRPILAAWSRASPVAILQPFPQRLWDRSALRPALAEFRAAGLGRCTARIVRLPRHPGTDTLQDVPEKAIAVPILELTPYVVGRWAQLLGGVSPAARLAAAILAGEPDGSRSHQPDQPPNPPTAADPAQMVRGFRTSVSPEAYRLAGYLSVVAPLSLPVMRLVEESMMPEAGPAELAEVFLGGLLRRLPGYSAGSADSVRYGFAAGTREILQSTITRTEALTLLDQVGSYLVHGQRTSRPFPAILARSSSGDIRTAAEQYPPFARVAGNVLERLGGPLAEAARHITPTSRTSGLPDSWPAASTSIPRGIITRPVLFVGLGGTGCEVGAELERRMREEICGADGNKFRAENLREGMRAYQLPSCVQFVYADMNQAELDRLPRRVVPGPEYEPAVAPTAHYVTALIPDVVSYQELSMRLRLEEMQVVKGWLPPWSDDEPRTNPLFRGAGQFPTIGRAALFGTFRNEAGIEPAVRDLKNAIGKLSNSGEDLRALGGRPPRGVDVFVAFSVAGGTGTGIFYDYLHLIADTITNHSALRVKIYPLVLMPSAFPSGLGGGRPAELNAGRAMLDLFRLVDQQNSADAERELRGPHDPKPLSSEEVAITYPRHQQIVMTPGAAQTALLFSQPVGATREDMHRSIVSLVMSLVGTEMSEEDNRSGEHHQSFADSFVNQAAHRQVLADNGLGNRGVSTALAASMNVPIGELAGIVGSRLLREAISEIARVDGKPDSTRPDIEEFLLRAGVHAIFQRQGNSDFSEPAPATGARDVTAALNNRRESIWIGIDALRTKLGREVPYMVERFNPDAAARDMLGKMDVFRLQRIVFGHHGLRDEVERGGAADLLQRRRSAPTAPAGLGTAPPETPELNDRFFRKVQWADPPVLAARNLQLAWYLWQTHIAWAEAWAAYERQWSPPLDKLKQDLSALTRALDEFARQDEDFNRRSRELYRARVGVSYMLPARPGRMEKFYQQVIGQLRQHNVQAGRIPLNSSEADLVQVLIGSDGWREAYRLSLDHGPEHALSFLRNRVTTEVNRFLRKPPAGQQPILPKLGNLLANAAGHSTGLGITQDYLDEFTGNLARLLPANYTPQGSGPLKVLVNYPAAAPSNMIAAYLKSAINLPVGPRITEDFRATRTESISVVLFRTSMGLTEVDEVRGVLRRWAGALAQPEPTDMLRWRQRTGYNFGYLATREDHRIRILHRLLCALWNGRATASGPEASPKSVSVEFDGGMTMTLPLTPLGQASSWGSLLRAYELWALDDDDVRRRLCGQLMRELPLGLGARPSPPSELYVVLRNLAAEQIAALDNLIERQLEYQPSRAGQMRGFWADTLPSALDLRFTGVDAPAARTLNELEMVVGAGGSG